MIGFIYRTLFLLLLGSSFAKAQESFQFMFLNTNPGKKVLPDSMVQLNQAGHFANMERLSKEGLLLIAGPFYKGGGIFVFKGEKERIWQELRGDSAIINNRFILELFGITPEAGGICPVDEGTAMTTYQFARFKPFSGSQVLASKPAGMGELQFLGDSIVFYGHFEDRSGSILVYRGKEAHPGLQDIKSVNERTFGMEEKQLNIAKGSFCEE